MAADIYSAIVAASGAVVLAGATYCFTKKRERDAELRKVKLEHYQNVVVALSKTVSAGRTDDDRRSFAEEANKLYLVAPTAVLEAFRAYQEGQVLPSTAEGIEQREALLSRLFFLLRKDLGLSIANDDRALNVRLWEPSQKSSNKK